MSPIVETKNLSKEYPGNVSLNYPDLKIFPGEFVKLSGDNGIGKTTLLKIIAGIISDYEGQLKRKSSDLILTFVPQSGGLIPNLSIEKNIQIKRILYNRTKLDSSTLLINHFGLSRFKNRPVHTLSGGFQKLVSILSALVVNPDIILLDEPLAGLQMDYEQMIIRVLQSYKLSGKTILMSSHKSLDKALFSKTIEL